MTGDFFTPPDFAQVLDDAHRHAREALSFARQWPKDRRPRAAEALVGIGGRHALAMWCMRMVAEHPEQAHHYGKRHHRWGWAFVSPGGLATNLEEAEAGARAFRDSLHRSAGIKSHTVVQLL